MLGGILTAIALSAASALPPFLLRGRAGRLAGTALAVVGSLLGLGSAGLALLSGSELLASAAWPLPGSSLAVRLDPLAAFFLIPVFLLGGAAALAAHGDPDDGTDSVRLFEALLVAAMASVVLAADGLVFLIAWEVMALAAFFLVATHHGEAEVRRAAWWYLIATHVGTLALGALFVLLRRNGSFSLGPGGAVGAIPLLLALVGFGGKAGLVPLHFWLPAAHANAPSHASALLSGAMLKVGVYGLVRVLFLCGTPPPFFGGLLVAIGLGSAAVGIALAIGQSDLKRALAYSSVENVGLVAAGLGLFAIGRARGDAALSAIGLSAALLHVLNHAIFKGLLFLSAGGVLAATHHERRIDRLGGLFRRLPTTGAGFLVGSCAAAGLPGTGTFLSEALLFIGFLEAARRGSPISLGGAVVAVSGALAVASFVRLFGIAFLGAPRSPEADAATEPPLAMRLPVIFLAAGALAVGLFPEPLLSALTPLVGVSAALPLRPFLPSLRFAALAGAGLTAGLVVLARRSPKGVPTWDCGYAAPTSRMQYTSRSLGETLAERLFPVFFRPLVRVAAPTGFHPQSAELRVSVEEPFEARVYEPFASRAAARSAKFRALQHGRLNLYLVSIALTLLAGIVWSVLSPWLSRWF